MGGKNRGGNIFFRVKKKFGGNIFFNVNLFQFLLPTLETFFLV